MPEAYVDPILFDLPVAEKVGPNSDLVDQIEFYIDHPVEWVQDIVGALPDPWQEDVLRALVERRFVSIRSGKGVGKSCLLAWIALWFSWCHPRSKVIITAPSKDQLYDVLSAECAQWIRKSAGLSEIFQHTRDKIYVKSDPLEWWIVFRTAEVRKIGKEGLAAAEGLQGRHSEAILTIVDEASGVDDAIMGTVEGSLTSPNSYIVLASNPTRSSGYFYDTHNSKRQAWACFHVNSEDSPHVDPDYCKRQLEMYGSRDAPMYLIGVRGEFPPAGRKVLYSLVDIGIAQKLDISASPYEPFELGVDVARFGTDYTAVAVRRGAVVLKVDKYFHQDTMQTTGIVLQYINEFKPASVKIDAIGIGAGVYDRLRELGYREVVPVLGSSAAMNTVGSNEKFINLRAEAHWRLKLLLEQRKIKLPIDDELVGQMTSITYDYRSNGKIYVESKEAMSDRGMKSPDKLDAIVLAFQPAIIHHARHAQVTSIPFMGR